MTTRYILHPGPMRSRTDGQTHYIGVGALLELYRVPRSAPYVVDDRRRPGFRDLPGDIHLRPRYDGNYPVFAQ